MTPILHRDSETGERRLPLMASFGIVSFVLTLALGLVLGAQIQHLVAARSVEVLTEETETATALTIHSIVSGLTYGRNGIPLTSQQQQAQVDVISSASRVLVAHTEIVAVEAVLADGTVIGGAATPPVGTKVPRDAGFRAALAGTKQVETLPVKTKVATPGEQRLLTRYGDLLVVQQGVRLSPRGPILAVVRSYTALGASRQEAAGDIRSTVGALGLGLIIFWAALFRLVLGASRRLTRQSQANVHLATHDMLTGLPNRVLLRDRTERAMLASRRSGAHTAVILIDLNRFKEVNDTLGHPYGDMLLQQIGPRLQEQLRDSDTIARLGGDEFVVMLPDQHSPDAAFDVAEKLAAALYQPFVLDGVEVDVDGSAGVVTTPDHGDDFDELLQHADVAMYAAKRDGLAVVEYDSLLDTSDPAKLRLLADLRRAIEHPEQFILHYQPQADLATGEIAGVEALVRWQHPIHGFLPPDTFIPLAEHTGIIRSLTWCILRAALEQNRR